MAQMVLRPTYNLDVAGARQLETELTAVDTHGGDCEEVRLDLSDVAFVASSGLRVMLKTAQQVDRDGVAFVVAEANDTVREVLKMSGFDTIIRVE